MEFVPAVRPFVLPILKFCSPQPMGECAYRLLVASSAVERAYPDLLENGITDPWFHMTHTPAHKLIVYPCRGGEFINMLCYVRQFRFYSASL